MEIKSYGHIEKAVQLKDGEVEFVVSTSAWDSHGERIDVDGISLKDYKKNPVVLWAHNGYDLPIAKATKIWKDGKKLMARAQFYLQDDFPRKVYNYVKDGYLNAVSIGGMVEEWGDDGLTIKKMNMKEFSVVPVPANQEAIVTAKSFTDNQRSEFNDLARSYALKQLANRNDNQIVKDIQTLEKLTAALKEVATSETHEEKANTYHVVLRSAQAVDHQVEKTIRSIKLKGNK